MEYESAQGLWNSIAFPVLSCPVGKDSNGLPCSVSVVGVPYNDPLLIDVAKEIEDAFGGWSLPVA